MSRNDVFNILSSAIPAHGMNMVGKIVNIGLRCLETVQQQLSCKIMCGSNTVLVATWVWIRLCDECTANHGTTKSEGSQAEREGEWHSANDPRPGLVPGATAQKGPCESLCTWDARFTHLAKWHPDRTTSLWHSLSWLDKVGSGTRHPVTHQVCDWTQFWSTTRKSDRLNTPIHQHWKVLTFHCTQHIGHTPL